MSTPNHFIYKERDDKNKLFVGNLPFKATPEELREVFSQFGEVLDVFIPRDSIGEPRGFAFVTCAEGSVDAIRNGADGVEFMGRTLTVNVPLAPGEKTERRPKAGTYDSDAFVVHLDVLMGSFTHLYHFSLWECRSTTPKKALCWKSCLFHH
jgi:hypothetical protein